MLPHLVQELSCALAVGEISYLSDRNRTEEELDAKALTDRLVYCFNDQVGLHPVAYTRCPCHRSSALDRMWCLSFKEAGIVFISQT